MGSFPHELSGYRHISGDAVRALVRGRMGRERSRTSRACAFPTCWMRRSTASFKGLYVQGEDILQSDPNTKHVAAGLAAMECVVVQDLFLNETANYAHVFLPGIHVPGEGRHLHQCGAAHSARAQGDAVQVRQGRLGDHARARQGAGLSHALRSSVGDHGRDRAPHADLCRRVV